MEFPGEKLVIKLWETLVEKGVGSLLSPWQAGRDGRKRHEIRRHEILMLAQAETDAADIRSGKKRLRSDGTLLLTSAVETQPSADERIEPTLTLPAAVECGNRAAAAAARSEINATKAVLFAEEQLASDAQVPPDRSIDEDWLFAWREHAGKVSTEDLQRLWGSVLAGEVKAPGRYSIRTLEFLKTLSKAEAEMISKLARYVIGERIARNQKEYMEANGLTFAMLLEIQDMGIISGVEALGFTTKYKSAVEGKFILPLISHNKALIIEHDDALKTLDFQVYMLTAVGRQVLGLGKFAPDIEYLHLLGRDFIKQGFSVKLADWQDISDTRGNYFNAQEVLADNSPIEA
jgi:hypothetical protein